MKITLESTPEIVELELDGQRMPARVWKGESEAGVPVIAWVTRISPQTRDPEQLAAFDAELRRVRTPMSRQIHPDISLRLIL